MNELPYERSVFDLDESPLQNRHLATAVKWAKFLAIAAMVFISIVLLGALYGLVRQAVTNSDVNIAEKMGEGIGQVLLASVFYYLSLALYRFSTNAGTAIQTNNAALFHSAFRYLKIFFKGIGICVIVILGLFLAGFVVEMFRIA